MFCVHGQKPQSINTIAVYTLLFYSGCTDRLILWHICLTCCSLARVESYSLYSSKHRVRPRSCPVRRASRSDSGRLPTITPWIRLELILTIWESPPLLAHLRDLQKVYPAGERATVHLRLHRERLSDERNFCLMRQIVLLQQTLVLLPVSDTSIIWQLSWIQVSELN